MNSTSSTIQIRKHSGFLKSTTWLVVLAELLLPFGSQIFAIENTVVMPGNPVEAAAVQHVTVNRKVPDVKPPSTELRFSANPTDEEIFNARVLSTPLVSGNGNKAAGENRELAAALLNFNNRSDRDDASALEIFIARHPTSPRYLSLLANLATHYRNTCQFSKALELWPRIWSLGNTVSDTDLRSIVDCSVAEWASFLVTLGRTDEISDLLKELEGRALSGAAAVHIDDVRSALWQMQNRPEHTFKCGPYSLYRLRALTGIDDPLHPLIMQEPSTKKGTSLTQNWLLAKRMGMNYQLAKRKPGSAIPVPCLIHWKLGHCSVVARAEKDGQYMIQDPTFSDTWISGKVLDEEASGYFLIPDGPLPQGWSPVSEDEGKTVWGRSTPTTSDPGAVTPCDAKTCSQGGGPKGMAQYAVHLLRVSLNITDEPVGYQPPVGPAVAFKVTYNEREAFQPAVFDYSNLGKQWTSDWLSYIEDDLGNTNAGVGMCVSGGGRQSGPPPSSGGTTYAAMMPKIKSRLEKTSTNTYVLTLQDCSKRFYNLAKSGSPRKVFLTRIEDPAGNAVTLTYDSYYRIVAATDAIGQVTTLTYGSAVSTNSMFYKITKVTDPFGRYATFQYNASGQLTNITDVIGMSSSFTYGASGEADFINSLTTPYGTTTFANWNGGFDRWLEITDPLGEKERVEFVSHSSVPYHEPANLVPAGITSDNHWLGIDNTFYWDRKAMHEGAGDVNKARLYHWISTADNYYVLDGAKASEKNPLEQRVWYQYDAQKVGMWQLMQMGTNYQPARVARVLDDGTTQLYQFEYADIGKVSKTVDPLGRTTLFKYSYTDILGYPENLLEVSQLVGTNGSGPFAQPITELLAKFTYNSQHVPLTAVDASGQTNFFGYNSRAQLTAITNARNEVITLSYNGDGYLTNISGALPDAPIGMTYDGYGRVRTVTDSDGYTVTYDYDAFDRPTKVTYPDNTYEQIVYEKLDPVLSRDRRGHWSRKIYNARRQLTAVADALGRVTQFGWCNCGSLESITDPLGRTTTWLRDLQGRVTGKVYPDATVVGYTYEQNTSRLKSVTDAKNQTIVYDYFKDNNLKQVTYSNAVVATPSVSFTYDTNYNRLLTMTDGVGTTAYSYNFITTNTPAFGAGRLASIDGPLANDTIAYGYDELGRITNRAINGVAQVVAYDGLGRVTVTTNALGSFTNAYVGNTARISTNFFPNGQTTTFNYYDITNDIRLQTVWHRNNSGATVSKFDYTYDADGQIATWTQQADAQTPTALVAEYDPVDQLLGATVRSNSMTGAILKQFVYGYDKSGNRTSETMLAGSTSSQSYASVNQMNQLTGLSGGGQSRFQGSLDEMGTVTVAGSNASFDSRNSNFVGNVQTSLGTNLIPVIAADYSGNSRTNNYQLIVTNNGVAQTLSYDLNGNLISAVTANATNTYEWDAADRLLAINMGTNRSEFTYDGLGRRIRIVEKQNGSAVSTNYFLWVEAELCEQRDSSGSTVEKRFFGPGEQISGANYFYTYDHLGSVRELTDSSGSIRARYDYDPYGRRTKVSGDLEAVFGFTGHFVHSSSGLSLTLYRAYDAQSARWLSRDPLGESGGLNLYSYVLNDPINLVDPFGLCPNSDYTDDFWVNVYMHGLDDAGRFFKRIVVIAKGQVVMSYKTMLNPLGSAYEQLKSVADLGSYLGTLSADECERQRAWSSFKTHMTSPEGMADLTILVETILAGNMMGEAGAAEGGACFVAGTEVSTENGTKPIEEIEEGDRVWSWDDGTGEVALKHVVNTVSHDDVELVRLELGEILIEATTEHPFWVEDKGWTGASHLRVGDTVKTLDGSRQITQVERFAARVRVYNLEVADFHTYFVSGAQVLVHNAGGSILDYPTKATKNWSAAFNSEGEARALARTKLGSDPVEVAPGKWRSADGKWQYRAKQGDVADRHIHLEELNPETGEVIQNLHLRWPEGTGR